MTNPSDMSNAALAEALERDCSYGLDNPIPHLHEAASRLRAMEWQPIETAPLDKQEVDIWVVWPTGAATRIPDSFHVWGRGWCLGQSYSQESHLRARVTHWMPRPAGPKGE